MTDRAFTLYFGGGEVPGWRTLLWEAGVNGVSLTYYNLRRRMPKKKPWVLAEQVPEGPLVLVESGAYTANKNPGQFDRDGWIAYDEEYRAFVDKNLDRIDLVTEFDSLILGPEYVQDVRSSFWAHIPQEKFMPVWHEQYGLDELDRLAEEYDHVAIPSSAMDSGARVSARINSLVHRYGTKFHGAAMTKSEVLMGVRFASASSTSWLSPVQYGDTIVWDGTRLRRYPKKYKEQARKRHRTLFTRSGFDAEKIADDDPTEIAKFSVWSWLRLEEAVGKRRGQRPFDVVDGEQQGGDEGYPLTGYDETLDAETAHPEGVAVDGQPPTRRTLAVARQERLVLPVFAFETAQMATGEVEDDGTPKTRPVEVMRPTGRSLRRCDTCFVQSTCPAFRPANECAYQLPLEIRNRAQLQAALTGVIEMQVQRVAFGRFAEELEGGYPDPNVGTEMDRLFKQTQALKEITDNRESFEVQIRGKANAGVLSRIFGSRQEPPTEPPPVPQGGLDQDQTDEFLAHVIDVDTEE